MRIFYLTLALSAILTSLIEGKAVTAQPWQAARLPSIDVDTPFCYMQKSTGEVLNLTSICGSSPVNSIKQLLSNKQCQSCDLSNSNLNNADLYKANLVGANLSGANLGGANLSGADLRGANLLGANLDGANLLGTNLSGATMPDGTSINP